jgi:hypothetical protein
MQDALSRTATATVYFRLSPIAPLLESPAAAWLGVEDEAGSVPPYTVGFNSPRVVLIATLTPNGGRLIAPNESAPLMTDDMDNVVANGTVSQLNALFGDLSFEGFSNHNGAVSLELQATSPLLHLRRREM